jgi:hypothetical protein
LGLGEDKEDEQEIKARARKRFFKWKEMRRQKDKME